MKLIAAGALMVAVAILGALSGPVGDANIGAGMMGLVGFALVAIGVIRVVVSTLRARARSR
jgi:hypothetical protein